MGKAIKKMLAWILIINGLIAVGFVMANMKTLWLPEYGQGFWWAWGSAFMEAPENMLFVILGLMAFIYIGVSNRVSGGKG